GILLVPLSAAAGWIARAQRTYRIGLGAASATVAIVGAWLFTRAVGAGLAWEAALWSVLLSLTFHVFVEWERAPGGVDSPAPAARGRPQGRVRGRRAGRAAAPCASACARRAAPAALALPWHDARPRRAGRAQRDAPGLRPGSARGGARHRARAVGLDVGVARARRDHAASPAGGRRAPLHRLAVPRRRPL